MSPIAPSNFQYNIRISSGYYAFCTVLYAQFLCVYNNKLNWFIRPIYLLQWLWYRWIIHGCYVIKSLVSYLNKSRELRWIICVRIEVHSMFWSNKIQINCDYSYNCKCSWFLRKVRFVDMHAVLWLRFFWIVHCYTHMWMFAHEKHKYFQLGVIFPDISTYYVFDPTTRNAILKEERLSICNTFLTHTHI